MKKFHLLLGVAVAVFSCLLISCGGNDFEDELSVVSAQNKLVGRWRNTMTTLTEGDQTIVWYFDHNGNVERVTVNDVVSDDKELNARRAEDMKRT